MSVCVEEEEKEAVLMVNSGRRAQPIVGSIIA